MKKILFILVLTVAFFACGEDSVATIPEKEEATVDSMENKDPLTDLYDDLTITTTTTMSTLFVGNGPQWGGYDNLGSWTGSPTLNDGDWKKLLERMDYMRPGLIRIMGAPGWNYTVNGMYNPTKSKDILFKILDYCQAKGINVMYGEWGQEELTGNLVDTLWLDKSVKFLSYLINTKSYTCLKYYNMCNEPAGSWSSIGGDNDLWQRTYQEIMKRLVAKGLDSKITVIAPDVAVWSDLSLTNWISRANSFFGDQIGAYDIHTYPSDIRVKNGDYKRIIDGYRAVAPKNKPMIMGELGYKYDASSTLGKENLSRIANDPYASDDSNMMIYDAFYGVDMADAVIQNMDAGYNGVILWSLDDAMYDNGSGKLKRWGFWNILGEEKFGGIQDESIRPWFYPMSLMCRFFPKGATIYKATLPVNTNLRAIAGMIGGKYTIAITNSGTSTYTFNLKMDQAILMTKASCYSYIASSSGAVFEGEVNEKGFAKPYSVEDIDFRDSKYKTITLKPLSFLLISNLEFETVSSL